MNILKRTLAGILVVFLAFGQVTSIPGTVDAVMGFSNLTTVGAIPYVSVSGTLNQDTNQLMWNAAEHSLGVRGTTSAGYALTVGGNVSIVAGAVIRNDAYKQSGSSAHLSIVNDNVSTSWQSILLNPGASGSVGIGPSNTSPTGTLHVYDATPTTGVTTQTIRAGAGQSTTVLQSWRQSNNTEFAYADPTNGSMNAFAFRIGNGSQGIYTSSGTVYPSTSNVLWSTTTNAATGSYDLGLARASANNLAITNGSSTTYATVGANGIILNNGRFQIPTSTPASASATCTAGTIAWDTNFTYVCVAKDTWKRAAIATW